MKKTMLLVSCCSLAILFSVSNVTAGEGEKDKKDPSLCDFLKTKVMKTIEDGGEYSKKAVYFYGGYILCRLATDYVVLPIYKKITALNEKEDCCTCEEDAKSKEKPEKSGYLTYIPFVGHKQ